MLPEDKAESGASSVHNSEEEDAPVPGASDEAAPPKQDDTGKKDDDTAASKDEPPLSDVERLPAETAAPSHEDDQGDDFASSVLAGLEHMRDDFDRGGSEPLASYGPQPDDGRADSPQLYGADFAASIFDRPLLDDGQDNFSASLSDRMSSLQPEPDESGFGDFTAGSAPEEAPDAANKHDALADAVQSALLSVYGEGQDAAAAQTRQGSGSKRGYSYSGYGSRDASAAIGAPREAEAQRPEDVILSYFSQSSAQTQQQTLRDEAQRSIFSHSDMANTLPYDDVPETDYFDDQARSASPASSEAPRSNAYTYQPARDAYPEPVQPEQYGQQPNFPVLASTDDTQAANLQDSGRLLGAAGLGLIGGIAFAAVLAVFLINSYEPAETQGPAGAASQRNATAAPGTAAPPVQPAKPQPEVAAADVSGIPGQTIDLDISLKAAPPNEQTLVSITGVPEGGRLTSGVDAGGGNWLLPPKSLQGLKLTLPQTFAEPVSIGVQLLDSNVRTPLTEKRIFEVSAAAPAQQPAPGFASADSGSLSGAAPAQPDAQPAAGQPETPAAAEEAKIAAAPATGFDTETLPAADAAAVKPEPSENAQQTPTRQASLPSGAERFSMPQTEIEDLIREGNRFMREGDIARARDFYQRAVTSGNAEAALAMGRSYDPSYFDRLERKTGEPDPAKAFGWYREAMNAGLDTAARVRIENLKMWLNQ